MLLLALPQLVLGSLEAVLLTLQACIPAFHLLLCTCATLLLLGLRSLGSVRLQPGSFLLDPSAILVKLRPFLLEAVLLGASALVALFLLSAGGALLLRFGAFLFLPLLLGLLLCSLCALLVGLCAVSLPLGFCFFLFSPGALFALLLLLLCSPGPLLLLPLLLSLRLVLRRPGALLLGLRAVPLGFCFFLLSLGTIFTLLLLLSCCLGPLLLGSGPLFSLRLVLRRPGALLLGLRAFPLGFCFFLFSPGALLALLCCVGPLLLAFGPFLFLPLLFGLRLLLRSPGAILPLLFLFLGRVAALLIFALLSAFRPLVSLLLLLAILVGLLRLHSRALGKEPVRCSCEDANK